MTRVRMTRARLQAILLALVALGLASVAAIIASEHAPSPRAPETGAQPLSNGKLIFDDEFNGSQLDSRHWSTCFWWGKQGCTIATNNELEWYQPSQVTVTDGAVRLVAARSAVRDSASGKVYPFASGMISTGPPPGRGQAKFAFLYGRVEARIRVPDGRGLWPGFWLLPVDRSSLPEIDVMEIIGQRPDELKIHLHYQDSDGNEQVVGATRLLRSRPGGWHVYGIDWKPDSLTWLVDGRRLLHVSGAAVPHVPMYLLANLAVGGDEPGPPSAATRFPSTMEIDWMRIWR